jgi:hypothetical protein
MSNGLPTRRTVVSGVLALAASPVVAQRLEPRDVRLVAAARAQVGVTLAYDPAYVRLSFPGGDVDRARGVCTDVIVRAYRDAFGLDLQTLVNADMTAAFASYPQSWRLSRPDPNIDHRRVGNLKMFFARAQAQLPMPATPTDWQAGDLVTSLVGGTLPHIGIVSDRRENGRPLVLHNIGAGTREEDVLTAHEITGRYRWMLAG